MSSKPTDSQEPKLGPGWKSLSRNTPASQPPTATPRIAYTKAQLLELYEPTNTATMPSAMADYPGLTSAEPLVPVNIAPDDHIAHVSALADSPDPSPPRPRFQSSQRTGMDAILARDPQLPPSAPSPTAHTPDPPALVSSTTPPAKKPGHVSAAPRDFWSGSAVLAPAERPPGSTPATERRPLTLKPRSSAVDRTASPPAHTPDKNSQQQPYWNRTTRGAADSNSNWRGGPNSAMASGGAKYPGSSNDDSTPALPSTTTTTSTNSSATNSRKSSADPASAVPPFPHPPATATTSRSPYSRDGGLFSRNNKDTLKPTNTRDLSALAKGSSRDPTAASSTLFADRDSRNPISDDPPKSQAEILSDQRKLWYYQDPQKAIQGPFAASQLMEWHKAGFYDEELPVSRSRDGAFKPLAIAFGLRKDEASAPSPPPGFMGGSGTPNKEKSAPTPSASIRPSREERNRRGTRTVEEMAKEVEMMRLQNHNKRAVDKPLKTDPEDASDRKEKSFFDSESQPSTMNGHTAILNEPLEDEAVAPSPISPTMNTIADTEDKDSAVTPLAPATRVNDIVKADPPVQQSRFISLMGRALNDVDSDPHTILSSQDPEKEIGIPGLSQPTQSVTDQSPSKFSTGQDVEEKNVSQSELPENSESNGSDSATPWSNMMMGLQQQNGTSGMPPMPVAASEHDLMAIDPAIAHVSFAKPSAQDAPTALSPQGPTASPELPPWLQFSTKNTEVAPSTSQSNPALEVSQALRAQSPLESGINSHSPHNQAQVRAQARVQAEAHARAEALVRAQAQAQAQHVQTQVRQMQAQEAQARAQHVSALARAQAQAQAQAQARAQAQAQAQVQAQARSHPQDQLWVLRHNIGQLQARWDVTYRAQLEASRAAQNARSIAAAARAGSPEQHSAMTVAAQADAAIKDHAVNLERIKAAAQNAHAHLVQHQAVLAREQQQRQMQAQSAQAPDVSGNISSRNLVRMEDSPIAPEAVNGSVQSSTSPAKHIGGQDTVQSLLDTPPTSSSGLEVPAVDPVANLSPAYEADPVAENQGWEKVNRKVKPVGSDVMAKLDREAEASEVTVRNEKPQKDASEKSPSISTSRPSVNNGNLQNELGSRATNLDNEIYRETLTDLPKSESEQSDSQPPVAPWSKATAPQHVNNGLSLREIQRQEEMRSKNQEKAVAAQQAREDATRVAAARTWTTAHPWGGAGDQSKPHTLSLREQIRIEEEDRKKSVVSREGAAATYSATSTAGPALGTKTGWASLVAKSKPPPSRPSAVVVGKKMDEEPSFWETVGAPRGVSGSAIRAPRRAAPQTAANIPSVHPNTTSQRTAPVPQTVSNVSRRAPSPSKPTKQDNQDNMSSTESGMIGGRISNEFAQWCTESLQKLTGNKNQDTTLVEYLVRIKSPSEIRDTVLQNLGSNDKSRSFADEFIRRLEFERTSVVADAGTGGAGGRKKGRRQRAAKVDPSLVLGFTSTSSSSRIMQGTIETPEMK